MAVAQSYFTDTNGRGVTYFLLQKEDEKLREDIKSSLGVIYENCNDEKYNGGTSRILESNLKLAYQMIIPMGRCELKHFRDLIRPIESPDIDKSDLERRLSEIEQLVYF